MTKEPTYWREKFRFHTKFINTRVHRIPKARFSKPDSLGRISIHRISQATTILISLSLTAPKLLGEGGDDGISSYQDEDGWISLQYQDHLLRRKKITLYSWRKFNPIVLVILIGNLDHFFRSLFNNFYWEIGYFPKKELSFLKLACNLVFYTTCSGGTK